MGFSRADNLVDSRINHSKSFEIIRNHSNFGPIGLVIVGFIAQFASNWDLFLNSNYGVLLVSFSVTIISLSIYEIATIKNAKIRRQDKRTRLVRRPSQFDLLRCRLIQYFPRRPSLCPTDNLLDSILHLLYPWPFWESDLLNTQLRVH